MKKGHEFEQEEVYKKIWREEREGANDIIIILKLKEKLFNKFAKPKPNFSLFIFYIDRYLKYILYLSGFSIDSILSN